MENLKLGLEKIRAGYYLTLNAISYADEAGENITDVMNENDVVVEAYQKCFTMSFDEEMVANVVELLDERFNTNMSIKGEEETGNHYVDVIKGLDLMVEGAELVAEVAKVNKEVYKGLVENVDDGEREIITPFKEFGVVGWSKGLRGYRRAFKAGLKEKLGRYQYSKLTK